MTSLDFSSLGIFVASEAIAEIGEILQNNMKIQLNLLNRSNIYK